ncbi:uncharacterized protein LOC123550673 [Mercenaria mercenaria]|uniref:uncharacterized protein LOC123550673 n=1 Tax=Mercenaria mercenaria TaxID=6596 RepID=UPI00234E5993|nr:uncharacterized protein LOC123550673 [Mercenaria mercenaria]
MHIDNGQITETGFKDVAKDLKDNLQLLQQSIQQRKDLSFVSIVDVSYQNGLVYLTFDVKDEAQLSSLYNCLKSRNNELSKWITTYFMERSLEVIAGLILFTDITCDIWMMKSVYHKSNLELCELEEELRDDHSNSNSNDATNGRNKSTETSLTSGSVKQKVKEIDQMSTAISDRKPKDYQPPVGAQSDLGRQPGGYPYKAKEHSTSDDRTFERKSFLLYYRSTKGWKVKQIEIQSDCKYLNANMQVHGIDMYEYSVDVPVDQFNVSYQYVCHLKSDSYLNIKGNLMGTPPAKSRKYRLDGNAIQRDSWMEQGQKIQDPYKFDEECLSAHLTDILFHCQTHFSITDACFQIEHLCSRKLPRTNAWRLLKEFAICLPSGTDKTRLLFAITIGNVLTHPQHILQEQIIDETTANSIMKDITKYRLGDLPKSCVNYMYSVCFSLCMLLFGSSMCLLEYLSTCYPFYDDKFLLTRLQNYVQSGGRIASEKESTFHCALELCRSLYKTSAEESSRNAKDALDILLRHLPFNMTLFVISKMRLDRKDVSVKETDLQNVLYSALHVRIEAEIRAVKKMRNIRRLSDLWKRITDTDKLNENLKSKFEEALFSILESYPASAGAMADIVVEFVLNFRFFQDEEDKRKLLRIIIESQNDIIRELFFILANCKEMESQFFSLENEQFQSFCLKYVTGNITYFTKRDEEFHYLLKRVSTLWEVPVVNQKVGFNDILVNILQREFERYHPKQLLQQLKTIDKISETNDCIATVFIGHIEKTLDEKVEKPEDLMDYISNHRGKPVVETRLSARLLCTILDNYGLSEKSSDFDNFLKLVSQYSFWILVFHCTGSFFGVVEKNDNYRHAFACISRMVKLFSTHEVHYDFVRKLEINQQSTSSAKKLLELKCERNEIEKYWSEALMKFKEVKDKLHVTRVVMTQVKRMSPNLPSGFAAVLKRIQDSEKKLNTGMITAVECDKDTHIWKDLETLPEICKYLRNVVFSTVFWNVSSDRVYEEYLLQSQSVDDDDPLNSLCDLFQEMAVTDRKYNNSENSCMCFMEILHKLGSSEYGDKWKAIIKDDECRMEEVLRMFGSSPDVSQEVDIARLYLHISIDVDVEECLKRIFSSDSVKKTVDAIELVLNAFGVDWKSDELFAKSLTSFRQLLLGAAEDYTFKEVQLALNTVFSLVRNLSGDTVNIMLVLGRSTTLITFLRSIVEEDIKNLIDAVEDISEQQVRESTVSALIEVKQFLHPLLLSKSKRNCGEFFQTLEKQTKFSRTNSASLPQKVEDCIQNLHNLKSLYNGVANRGEQTKEMIKNIIQKGVFSFQLRRSYTSTSFEASYKQNKTKEIRKRSTLIDLRSRALLLMNTERKSTNEGRFNRDELLKFVENIDLCLDIAEILFALFTSGHTNYMTVKETVRPHELSQRKDTLKLTLESWLLDLNEERDSHYLMTFIQGNQIHILYKYLEEHSGDTNVVQTILNFIHPKMQAVNLKKIYYGEKVLNESWSNRRMLHCMGFALHSSFEGLNMFQRNIKCHKIKTLTSTVQPSRLTVAQLDEGSLHTVKTVLALYTNTTQRLPEPNHILFCTRETTWTELELLVRRCLGANEFYKTKVLFCIANVEMLPNEIQFNLVETLRHLRKDKKFHLAIICRGSRSHPFIDELSDCVTSITPVTDKTVRDIFMEHCENVVTVTSKFPGLGKSSYIVSEAHKQRKGVVTLHVSGSVRKMQLVDRINGLCMRRHHVLHIDLGNVDSPSELDTFLFELVVLRYVSAGNSSVSLHASGVYIEIANTINDTLRNALQTAVLFRRVEIEWNGIDDLIISNELNSPVQVVCRYLKHLENGSIDRKDISFDKISDRPLSSKRCKTLLHKYVGGKLDSSFPVLFTFLNVLADQLKKMTHSSFFKISRLIDMVGNKVQLTVKSSLVEAMIEVSSDFATRSVDVCRESQISTIATEENYLSDLAASVTHRVDSMIRWEESNHLMFVFHNQNIHTISALYRNLSKVPYEIKNLFESQIKKKMEDFNSMDQEKLQRMLQKVARINPFPLPKEQLLELSKDYALTADNLLKMVLIMLRIKANIPVVIMGETGCGKTSLIRYLAAICDVDFDVMNIHAGVKEEDIVVRVLRNNENALIQMDSEKWLFLDEINTSDNIGIISDIMCHHRCLGKELSPNLIIMGACNPYKLRTTKAISTAGLEGKAKSDELSRLVYRVLPLPEMMVDYVWDFGSLNEKDEETYIYRMVSDIFLGNEKHHQLFTSLLAVSQSFVRRKEDSTYSVSLRDVHRCKLLIKWFLTILPKKKLPANAKSNCCDITIKAMILSLAHCYQSRFAEKHLRKEYRGVIGDTFILHGHQFAGEQDDFIQMVIKDEQSDILRRMQLPPGTARNTALQENVFVILVCIFNRIPIFVVGKPGCSKSLAMQLIKSNLRGKDSEDEFFRELPQLYCVSFQGSESSTSDGIIKVFEKAEKYQESNNIEEVLSVVILDEIGLAEVSRFNPLKVLHNLLEPDGASQPNVAVVGISNWALDASKMNRAIHLSRTDMDEDELYDTAISISESFLGNERKQSLFHKSDANENENTLQIIERELNGMAKAYFQYINELRFKNFHGLRDYYSLIKFVARVFAEQGYRCSKEDKAEMITDGIARNFGGLPDEMQTLYVVFQRHLPLIISKDKPLMELITENIKDPIARHLMLITTGESVLGIIEQKLKEIGCDRKEVIFGSQFEEDLTDDYNYRILSRIILCMEEGVVLILKDLESIYGSLYDMLNQNYTIIGKKKNCRVALGAYSNPICHVSDSFRCIVLTDEKKLDLTDPPFLNRFEKQYLRFFDIIQEKHTHIIQKVENWLDELSDTSDGQIEKEEMLPVYNNDLTASLVLKTESDYSEHFQESEYDDSFLAECKQRLMCVMKPEVVIRQRMSKHPSIQSVCDDMIWQYFSLPIHNGLQYFILQQIETPEESVNGLLNIIFTNSNVHTKVKITSERIKLQVEKLGAFKSEKQLSSRIQQFWDTEECNILIVQCNAKDDEKHILLTKLVIERYRNEYIAQTANEPKHVYVIIHLDRSRATSHSVSQLNFLSEWKLVMMDSLDTPAIPLPSLYKMTLQEAILEKRPLSVHIQEELFWAFSRIRYGNFGRDVASISDAIVRIEESPELMEIIQNEILSCIRKQYSGKQDKYWQLQVASDVTALTSSASFIDALEHFIMSKLKEPLAKLVYKIELTGILESFFPSNGSSLEYSTADQSKRTAWVSGIHDERMFSIEGIPDETGPECYTCETVDFALKMPFSKFVYESIEATKDDFMETVRTYRLQCLLNEDEEMPSEVYDEVLLQQEQFLLRKIPDLNEFTYEKWEDDYLDDFSTIGSHIIFTGPVSLEQTQFLKLILERLGVVLHDDPFVFVLRLHTIFWVHFAKIRSEMILIDRCICVIPESRNEIQNVLSQFKVTEHGNSHQGSNTFEYTSFKKIDEKDTIEKYSTGIELSTPRLAEEYQNSEQVFEDNTLLISGDRGNESKYILPSPLKELQLKDIADIEIEQSNIDGEGIVLDKINETHKEAENISINSKTILKNNNDKMIDTIEEEVCEDVVLQHSALMSQFKENAQSYQTVTLDSDVDGDQRMHGEEGRKQNETFSRIGILGEDHSVDIATEKEVDHDRVDRFETDIENNSSNACLAVVSVDSGVLNSVKITESIKERETVGSVEHYHLVSENLRENAAPLQADTKNTYEDSDAFSNLLVNTVCKAMLPTTECLKQHRGLKHWLGEVTSTVSLAAQVSRSPKILYSLRICIELAAELIIPLNLESGLLEHIGNTMKDGSALDTEPVFCAILALVDAALTVSDSCTEDISIICQRSLSSYFLRCISADPETEAFQFLFKLILQKNIPENCITLFKVPLYTFMQTIDGELLNSVLSTDILKTLDMTILETDTNSSFEECGLQLLECLDNCLKVLLKEGRFEDPFLILIADLLQDLYRDELLSLNGFDEGAVENFSREAAEVGFGQRAIELFYICHKSLKEHEPGLKYIASAAYCKSFVSHAANFLQYANSEDYGKVLNILDVALSDLPGTSTHFLTIFFLKQMLSSKIMSQLLRFCIVNEDKYKFLRDLEWSKSASIKQFDKSPLCMHVRETVHKDSCFDIESIESSEVQNKIETLVANASSSRCGMLQFFAFVLREFYLQLTETDLDDTRRTQAQLILNEVMGSDISTELRIFVSCILGEQNFNSKDFVLTDASSPVHICKASFLTSLYSLILAYNEFCSKSAETEEIMPIFTRCLVCPGKIKTCFIPGFPSLLTEQSTDEAEHSANGSGIYIGQCQCGYRIASSDRQIACVVCSRDVTVTERYITPEFTVLTTQGNNLNINTVCKSETMNPVTSHILQMLVKGCLLGSLSLGFTSENTLESALMLPENDDAVNCLSQGIGNHWDTMKELLNVDDKNLTTLLHAVLLKANKQLFCTKCCFENLEETVEWEKAFDNTVFSVLKSRCSNIRTVYQHHNRIHKGDKCSITMILFESNELSNIPDETKLACLPATYRIRANSAKSNFQYELHERRDKFPLITAVIEQEKDLQLPKHILNLVQWHAATVANASYMLKSHDCSMMTVQDFIYFKQHTMKKDVMKSRFEAFRKSWDTLRSVWQKDDISEKMERIHSESKINECLILSDESLPFKVLQKLIGIQNSFLDKVLLFASNCDALKMLERDGVYVLPCVHVTEVKKEELVNYEVDWETLIQQESQSNLTYGCGGQIHYDFHSIEEAVAHEVVLGKSYIISGNSLPEIVFIDELHKNYASLIRELRKTVPQLPLPAEIGNGIKSRKAEDPRMSVELLTHLGIVMTLLKKTKGDKDQPLVDFVDKWKSILCRDFPKKLLPSPESCVKLCHVVALSELLEELCADSVKEGLGDEYRDKLDGPLQDHLLLQLKDEKLSSVLFKAFKRFTYRCLASKTADPKQSLRLYLTDESFWPMDVFQYDTLAIGGNRLGITDVLPDGLMVRHIFECFDLMETEIEKRRQGNIKMSGFATSFQAKSKATVPSKAAQKKKKLTAIRKF